MLISHIHSTVFVEQQLLHVQGSNAKTVIMPVSTRWNSQYLSLSRFLELRHHIEAIMEAAGCEKVAELYPGRELIERVDAYVRVCYQYVLLFFCLS